MKLSFENIFIDATKTVEKIPQTEYLPSGQYPIIDQGQRHIAGYSNHSTGFCADVPAIIFGDHTRVIKYIDKPFFIGADGVKVLKSKSNATDYKYLFYALSSIKIPNTGYNRHFKWLKGSKIPVYNSPLQKRIAKRLDKVQELIAKQKEQIAKLDLLIKSRFLDMFGDPISNPKKWVMKKLKECARTNLSYGSGAKAVNYNGTVRYIRITDIDNQGLLNKEKKSPSIFEEKYLLHQGELLFARTGATVGKTFLYDKKYGMSVYAGYLIRFVPKIDLCHPLFVFYFTHTDYYKQFVLDKQKAVAQPNINAQEYGELLIPLPPLSLQTQFTNFVKSVEQQKEVFSTRLSHLEILYKSLMQEYFG